MRIISLKGIRGYARFINITHYEAIHNSPHWESSLLIINYDEHGGFYDHAVPPATVSLGDSITDEDNNHHDFDFKQPGTRVPAVIVSPFIQLGIIDHQIYDYTSVIKTVVDIFGFGILTQRDAHAHSLRALLSLTTPRTVTPTLLPEIPDSGWQCSSIIDEIIDGTGLDKILRVQAQHAEEELAASIAAGKKIIDPGLRGFMHIAFLCHYHLAPIEQRNAIVAQFLAVRTDSQARAFVLEAKKYIRAHKLSNPASKLWQRHVSKQQERAE